jgi:hypothetical protein
VIREGAMAINWVVHCQRASCRRRRVTIDAVKELSP